jgi:cytochrome c
VVAQRTVVLTVGFLVVIGGSASAQREATDLKTLPPSQQVASLRYCRGAYDVRLKDGSVRSFKEYDLGFKTDTSDKGPAITTPVLVPTGRVGDRAFVIFAGLDELKAGLKKEC